MKIVAAFLKVEDAYLARSRLEGSGVVAHLRDDAVVGLDWFLSHALGGVKVVVADDDVQRAREILDEKEAGHGMLYCPHCGSGAVRMREIGVVNGLLLLFWDLILPIRCRTADCPDCRKSSRVDECLKAGKIGQDEHEGTEAQPVGGDT